MRKLLLSAIAVLALLACSKSQLLKVVAFQDVEGEAPPIASDVITIIEDTLAFVVEDNAVAVVQFDVHFYDVPFGGTQPPGYGAHLTRYQVTFTSLEDAAVPASHEGVLNVIILPGEDNCVSFTLVPAGAKEQSPLVELVTGGELRTVALVEFWGTEDKTGSELYASGELDVNFANWADD